MITFRRYRTWQLTMHILLWVARWPRNWNRQQSRHRDLHLATRIQKAPRPTASVPLVLPLHGVSSFLKLEMLYHDISAWGFRSLSGKGCGVVALSQVLILHVGSAAIQSPWEDGREWPKMPHASNKPGRFGFLCKYCHTMAYLCGKMDVCGPQEYGTN